MHDPKDHEHQGVWVRHTPGGKHRASYRGPDGRTASKTFETISEAKAWLAKQKTAVREGKHTEPRLGRERFDAFWFMVAECLTPRGRVFFADDAYRTPDELIEGDSSTTIQRRLEDGTGFRAVKVPHTASGLERRLTEMGWQIEVRQTSGPFYWGSGSRP